MRIPVSVFYIVKNEAVRLPISVRSVREWVDEVVVVDSGSSDATCVVAKQYGADKVLFNEWAGYGRQKRFAEDQCKHKWLINLDADEEISSPLKDEIINLFSQGEPDAPAYRFRIRNMYCFERKPSWAAGMKDPIRLYDKTKARFRNDPVHDSVIFNEATPDQHAVCLKGDVFHRSIDSLSHKWEKINIYSEAQAEKMYLEGRCPSACRILLEGPASFLKAYFLRKHFAYGVHGYAVALIWATGRVLRLAKAREKFKLFRLQNHKG